MPVRLPMSDKLIRLRRKPFVRNVSVVAAGTMLAQAISIGFAPVITRLYGPEAFGVLGVFLACTTLIASVGSLTYDIAIVLPEKDDEARAVATLAMIIALALSLISTLGLLLFREPLIRTFNLESISSLLMLMPLLIFFTACQKIAMQWLIRTSQFVRKAWVRIFQSLFLNIAKSGVGLINPTAMALVVVSTLGEAIHAIMLIGTPLKRSLSFFRRRPFPPWFCTASILEAAYKHRDFPLYQAPNAVIKNLTSNLPMLLFAGFFGPIYAGYYALGEKVLKNPSRIISQSVGDVFFARIARACNRDEDVGRLLIRVTFGMAVVGVLPFLALAISGPMVFGVVFGKEWTLGGEYARWLSIWLFFDFISGPASKTVRVIGIQRFYLIHGVVTSAIRISMLLLGALHFRNDLLAVALFSMAGAGASIVLIAIVIMESITYSKIKQKKQASGLV